MSAETNKKGKTKYIVFRQAGDAKPDGTVPYDLLPGEHEVTAGQKRNAIKAATKDLPVELRNGTFEAVPARTWKPIERKVETREVDEWGNGEEASAA